MFEKDFRVDIVEFMVLLMEVYLEIVQAYEFVVVFVFWISKDVQVVKEYNFCLFELCFGYGGIYNVLGYIYMVFGEMGEVKVVFEKYFEVLFDEFNVWDSMGEYYMVVKDYVKLVEYYDKVVEMGMEFVKERVEKVWVVIIKN